MTKGQQPGRGDVTRGRADAHLEYKNQTEGTTDAFKAKKLPPGRLPSKEWERTGLRRTTPTTQPERAGATGGAGDQGAGEASWRRRLAPHHRDVVRKYFSTGRSSSGDGSKGQADK